MNNMWVCARCLQQYSYKQLDSCVACFNPPQLNSQLQRQLVSDLLGGEESVELVAKLQDGKISITTANKE